MKTLKKLFSCGDQQFGCGSQYSSQYLSPETVCVFMCSLYHHLPSQVVIQMNELCIVL
jgi:hypothetical protein